ncbi:MAG: anaerobic glycerol-3-phosphate dehydrogenase subunit GlpB [Candidatus Thorarchaeota archaeon]|jgi:glycerol-3-phosphate dehydrogenase subunit B
MNFEPDVLVIGGGMAGLVSGTVAAKDGLETLLIRRGQGATVYSSGAIDVIGYPPGGFDIKDYFPSTEVPFKIPSEGLEVISGLYPYHPYGMFGLGSENEKMVDSVLEEVKESLTWLKGQLKGSCAPLVGDFQRNIQPITILGTVKPTCLIQETMWSDDLNSDPANVLIFTGFRGHPEFSASAATRAYLEHQVKTGNPPHKVGHCILDITPYGKPYNISGVELARHFDHDEAIIKLAESLKVFVEQLGATHVALPPVLGLDRAVENKSKLENSLNVKVFELLAFPPSVPGLRLQRALDEMYTSAGGVLLIGHEALSASMEDELVQSIRATSPRREVEIQPKAVILASGKFIGGGLEADEKGLSEPVFDLMTVNAALHSAEEMLPCKQTNVFSLSPNGHELFGAGLTVDTSFRPVGLDGVESARNLFCAGSIIGLYNYSLEKSGLGVALCTGRAAGRYASQFVQEVG